MVCERLQIHRINVAQEMLVPLSGDIHDPKGFLLSLTDLRDKELSHE